MTPTFHWPCTVARLPRLKGVRGLAVPAFDETCGSRGPRLGWPHLGNHYVVVPDLAGRASLGHRFVSASPIRAPHKKENAVRGLCPLFQFFEVGC
jgi:hypothetical protein